MIHLARLGGILLFTGLGIVYPFLPGRYDGLAAPLSTLLQLAGAAGLPLVPLGALWLGYELRARAREKRNLPPTGRGQAFASVALVAASLAAATVLLLVCFGISMALGVLALALWVYALSRWLPGLQLLKQAPAGRIHPAPLYLITIPLAVLLIQAALAAPLTESSRSRAMANSHAFIGDIEAYHEAYGRYPVTLAAMWKDYDPGIAGIEKYHYAPSGESYNLFFEQPRFLFDQIGTREWVVYNPHDEPRMYSHTAWFLLLTPEALERSQGWYAVREAGVPHWKYFWFD